MGDTVLLVGMVTRGPWEIDDNEGSVVRFLNYQFVQLDRCVHSTKIIIMSGGEGEGGGEVIHINCKVVVSLRLRMEALSDVTCF